MRFFLAPLILGFLVLQSGDAGAQWGDVKLTFLYAGKPPKPAPLAAVKAECVFPAPAPPLVDETWIINPKSGGVQNVVVRLLPEKGVALPIHSSFDKAEGTAVRIDNEKCRFVPRVSIKYTNQDLVLGNKDGFGHNVKADFFENLSFNVLIPAKGEVKRLAVNDKLDRHEAAQSILSCGIHPHMKGYLFVQSHPYCGVTDANGDVTIKNIPLGEWTFVMWHEAGGFIKKGTLGAAAKEWPKGRIKIKVVPGLTTVGPVTFK